MNTIKCYVKVVYKGTKIDGTDGRRTTPSQRIISRESGRGTYKKDTPMVAAAYWRSDKTERDKVVYGVSKGDKKLADTAAATFEPGSRIYTDDYGAYNSLEKTGHDHHTVSRSEGEYASGKNNKIHTNNCECLVGLLKWWLKNIGELTNKI